MFFSLSPDTPPKRVVELGTWLQSADRHKAHAVHYYNKARPTTRIEIFDDELAAVFYLTFADIVTKI